MSGNSSWRPRAIARNHDHTSRHDQTPRQEARRMPNLSRSASRDYESNYALDGNFPQYSQPRHDQTLPQQTQWIRYYSPPELDDYDEFIDQTQPQQSRSQDFEPVGWTQPWNLQVPTTQDMPLVYRPRRTLLPHTTPFYSGPSKSLEVPSRKRKIGTPPPNEQTKYRRIDSEIRRSFQSRQDEGQHRGEETASRARRTHDNNKDPRPRTFSSTNTMTQPNSFARGIRGEREWIQTTTWRAIKHGLQPTNTLYLNFHQRSGWPLYQRPGATPRELCHLNDGETFFYNNKGYPVEVGKPICTLCWDLGLHCDGEGYCQNCEGIGLPEYCCLHYVCKKDQDGGLRRHERGNVCSFYHKHQDTNSRSNWAYHWTEGIFSGDRPGISRKEYETDKEGWLKNFIQAIMHRLHDGEILATSLEPKSSHGIYRV